MSVNTVRGEPGCPSAVAATLPRRPANGRRNFRDKPKGSAMMRFV